MLDALSRRPKDPLAGENNDPLWAPLNPPWSSWKRSGLDVDPQPDGEVLAVLFEDGTRWSPPEVSAFITSDSTSQLYQAQG